MICGKGLHVVGANKLLLIIMIIPHNIFGKGDTLKNKEEKSCLADKEAAWEIIKQQQQKKTPQRCL